MGRPSPWRQAPTFRAARGRGWRSLSGWTGSTSLTGRRESALEICIIRRSIPAPPSFLRAFLKPFVPSVIMAAAAWATYGLLTNFLHMGNSLATIGGIGVGVVVYLVLVLALRVLSREDLELMPKGDKIAKILHIK